MFDPRTLPTPLRKWVRLWHTVRYLHARQVVARMALALPRRVPRKQGPDGRRPLAGAWQPMIHKCRSVYPGNEFRFLNDARRLRFPGGWNDGSASLLWLYNLHYFDDLAALDSQDRVDEQQRLIADWMAGNLPANGVGWQPYPTSLRIVNWIKWVLSGGELPDGALESLSRQAEWLTRNIEWHILGNHLFANAKALLFAGFFIRSRHSGAWVNKGKRIIERELDEQVLSDYGHFEQSPMYHSIVLEDCLDLLNVLTAFGETDSGLSVLLRKKTAGMLGWLHTMCHPDGNIALFGDSAFSIAPTPAELFDYASRLGVRWNRQSAPTVHLDGCGYVRSDVGAARLFVDVGPVGPSYLPAHGHADALSFELSLWGGRWIVDAGCSTYEVGGLRDYQRSTRAHNTVEVDSRNSSDVWAGFRVGRRANVKLRSIRSDDKQFHLKAEHDGYSEPFRPFAHSREVRLASGELTLTDELRGHYRSAVLGLLLHPDVSAHHDEGAIRLAKGGRTVRLHTSTGKLSIELASWFPEFGVEVPTRRIQLAFDGPKNRLSLAWSD